MQLLLAGDEHHVAADHLAECAFDEERLGEAVEVGDFLVVLAGELIDGQEALVGIEAEMAAVVVGEIPGVAAIADDEELDEAEQRLGVAVAGVVLVIDDLLHGPARADAEGFQLDLHDRHAVDEQYDVVAVMAVVGVDAELIDDLEVVFAPVLDVDQGVVQRRAVVAGEAVALAEGAGGGEDIGGDDLLEKARRIRRRSGWTRLSASNFSTKVLLQRGAVTDVRAIFVLEILEFRDKGVFKSALGGDHRHCSG